MISQRLTGWCVAGVTLLLLVPALSGGVPSASHIADLAAPDRPQAPFAPLVMAPDLPVADLLTALGEPRPDHWLPRTPELIARGEQLVHEGGATRADGRRGRQLSGSFRCVHCHNVQREDPDLRVSDPEARLDYAQERDLPLLPATTFYGMVNRLSWFNEDYERKYGELVQPARRSLRNAVLLCASECSQGRLVEDWELDAILAYMWSLELRLADLDLSERELEVVDHALTRGGDGEQARAVLRASFLPASPATIVTPPTDRRAGRPLAPRADRGEAVWRTSCLHCHGPGGPGQVRFQDHTRARRRLWRDRVRHDRRSPYHAVRYGTRPYGVPVAYMPFYTSERLSEQMMVDLLAFLAGETP